MHSCSGTTEQIVTALTALLSKHFITKTDINNIQMKVKDFSIKRHENDALSVNLIVEEL